MTQQINGMMGDWAIRYAQAKPIPVATKVRCLELFKFGIGFHRVARMLELRPYTVRDWLRRLKSGDESWATRVGHKFTASCIEARNLIQYRDEIETIISCHGTDVERNGSSFRSKQPFAGGENPVVGSPKQVATIPLYRIGGIRERILAGGSRKKKEIAAVQSLIASGVTTIEACRIAKIPKCTYYRALKPSEKAKSDAELVTLMCNIENDKHISSTYGIDRLTGEVNNRLKKVAPELASLILHGSSNVNHKRIHRLMKEYDIHSRIRRRKHPDNYYKEIKETQKANFVPNILGRNFTAEMPMTKLTTDVTYIPCSDQKFVYLSPLADLFNHEIVSYAISLVNSEEFVKHMLTALPPEFLKGAMIHNDQGSLYWSNGWVKKCDDLHIIRSMSRRGNCWDNALSEHIFSAIKVDLGLSKSGYKTLLSAKEIIDLINDYIPWYNNGRIQKKLNYLSPVQFKEAYLDNAISTGNGSESTIVQSFAPISHNFDAPYVLDITQTNLL